MKKYILLLLLPMIFGCESDKFNNHNPYIENYSFTIDVNLNLPLYNSLRFAGNSVYLANGGVRGVWLFNSGSGYYAYDAACPNQPISDCSTMVVTAGSAKCPCDNVQYSMYTGIGEGMEYPMKQYRVQVSGDNIQVFN